MTATDGSVVSVAPSPQGIIGAWAQAVRDGDMVAILANHTDDIIMFDVPVPLQSKGMAAYRAT